MDNIKELRGVRANWENKIDTSIMASENRITTNVCKRIDELDDEWENLNFNTSSEVIKISKKIDKVPK
jgi:hypothetical protein